jgi:hypothetical protein
MSCHLEEFKKIFENENFDDITYHNESCNIIFDNIDNNYLLQRVKYYLKDKIYFYGFTIEPNQSLMLSIRFNVKKRNVQRNIKSFTIEI